MSICQIVVGSEAALVGDRLCRTSGCNPWTWNDSISAMSLICSRIYSLYCVLNSCAAVKGANSPCAGSISFSVSSFVNVSFSLVSHMTCVVLIRVD